MAGVKGKSGRPSTRDSAALKEWYFAFLPKVQKVITEALMSKSKTEQKWAVEQVSKGLVKLLPTQVTGEDGEAIQVQWQSSQSITIPEDGPNISITA